MSRHLSDLRDNFRGQDIWLIGSGPSLDFVDPAFFANKVAVCLNHTIDWIGETKATVLFSKEPSRSLQEKAIARGIPLVTCREWSGVYGRLNDLIESDSTFIYEPRFGAAMNRQQSIALEAGTGSLPTALHLAALMGAANILLVGCDGGSFDGRVHYSGYDTSHALARDEDYARWHRSAKVDEQVIRMRKVLASVWGVAVYSLNPFVSIGLEGHRFEGFTREHSNATTANG